PQRRYDPTSRLTPAARRVKLKRTVTPQPEDRSLAVNDQNSYFCPGFRTIGSAVVSALTRAAHLPASWAISSQVPKWVGITRLGRISFIARIESSGPIV